MYVPRSWTTDPDRCRAAGLGEETAFAAKPELAARMIGRFPDAGHQVGRVPGDEVYGGDPKPRSALGERKIGYVLAVACSAEVTTGAGKFRADALAAKVPRRAWQKLPAGAGAKGHRFCDWAVIDLDGTRSGSRRLLIRRSRSTGELAHCRCCSPAVVPLAGLVRVAGSRWRVEGFFQSGKGLATLDEHQVRRYAAWSRWVTLAVLAHAFLAVVRGTAPQAPRPPWSPPPGRPATTGPVNPPTPRTSWERAGRECGGFADARTPGSAPAPTPRPAPAPRRPTGGGSGADRRTHPCRTATDRRHPRRPRPADRASGPPRHPPGDPVGVPRRGPGTPLPAGRGPWQPDALYAARHPDPEAGEPGVLVTRVGRTVSGMPDEHVTEMAGVSGCTDRKPAAIPAHRSEAARERPLPKTLSRLPSAEREAGSPRRRTSPSSAGGRHRPPAPKTGHRRGRRPPAHRHAGRTTRAPVSPNTPATPAARRRTAANLPQSARRAAAKYEWSAAAWRRVEWRERLWRNSAKRRSWEAGWPA